MDLVSALMVLQTADEEELQFHGIQTILTLRQVGQRLQAHILPDGNELSIGESEVEGNFSTSADFSSSGSSRHSSPVTSTNKDASNEGPRNGYLGGINHLSRNQSSVRPSLLSIDNTTRKTRKFCSKAEILLKDIMKKVPSLWSMKEDDVINLISRKRSSTTDRRIEDIALVEGDTEAQCKEKLLRVSALLSYASEFESYQQRHALPSRVDNLVQLLLSGCFDPKSLHERKRSSIAKYVKGVSQFKGRERFICRATGNGVKFAVVKKLLEAKLESRGLPSECHAILPALGLVSHRLFGTTYQNLLDLVDLLLSDQALVTLPSDGPNESDGVGSSQRHILDAIREMSPWSKGFQNYYEYIISLAFPMDLPQPNQKRARHSQRDELRGFSATPGDNGSHSNFSVANSENPPPVYLSNRICDTSQTEEFSSAEAFPHGTSVETQHITHHTCPTEPFNDLPLMGFADWGIPSCEMQGFQDVFYQPIVSDLDDFGIVQNDNC